MAKNQDTSSHHSSPNSGTQKQMPVPPPKKSGAREVTGTVRKAPDVPMHVTKHPNPVGRPRSPRY